MIISRSIHLAVSGIISCFLMAEKYSIIYMHHAFFIHSSVSGQLDCFHIWAIVNSTTVNIGVQVSFKIVVFGYMPRSGIARSYGNSIFTNQESLIHAHKSHVVDCRKWHIVDGRKILGLSRLMKSHPGNSKTDLFYFIYRMTCLCAQSCPILCDPVDCTLPDSQEDPRWHGATVPVGHTIEAVPKSLGATTTEASKPRAAAPQREKRPQREALLQQVERNSCSAHLEESPRSNEDPAQGLLHKYLCILNT